MVEAYADQGANQSQNSSGSADRRTQAPKCTQEKAGHSRRQINDDELGCREQSFNGGTDIEKAPQGHPTGHKTDRPQQRGYQPPPLPPQNPHPANAPPQPRAPTSPLT